MKKAKKAVSVIAVVLAAVFAIAVCSVLLINSYVKSVGSGYVITPDEVQTNNEFDCIMVLGCGVRADGTPSDMLRDRLDRGVELYFAGASGKLLMSGDHGSEDYDEVNIMKQYAIDKGVPSEDIFMDHAGFSTYESVYRAKAIFGVSSMLVVTQEYHLYRALYICDKMGINAKGIPADYNTYAGQTSREIREILARNKDFFTSIFKPLPTYLGESIPVSGNGDVTND